jgi:hypothetical protein
VPYEIDDIISFLRIGSTDDAYRLVESDVYRLDFVYDKFSVYFHFLSRKNSHSHLGAFTVDSYTALFYKAVGFTSGTKSGVADIFI